MPRPRKFRLNRESTQAQNTEFTGIESSEDNRINPPDTSIMGKRTMKIEVDEIDSPERVEQLEKIE